jgi:hypothetical protein
MDKEYFMEVVQTIKSQLLGTTPINTIMSWGVSEFIATSFKDMPTLMFHVSGRLFKGFVMVTLNEGADYYEIYLMNEDGIRCIAEDVSFEDFGDLIDVAVERGENRAEYEAFCQRQYEELLRGNI